MILEGNVSMSTNRTLYSWSLNAVAGRDSLRWIVLVSRQRPALLVRQGHRSCQPRDVRPKALPIFPTEVLPTQSRRLISRARRYLAAASSNRLRAACSTPHLTCRPTMP